MIESSNENSFVCLSVLGPWLQCSSGDYRSNDRAADEKDHPILKKLNKILFFT